MKNQNSTFKIGVDAGSTTIKIVVLDSNDNIIYKSYTRHKADINNAFIFELKNISKNLQTKNFQINITGSAGMGISERTNIPFIQEVIASVKVIKKYYKDTHTLIDLGGEDAKMVFFENGKQPDIRMNGSCAGGTGAFIDQMADLMNIGVEDLGKQALKYKKIHTVASRCGVFAKTDVQNLISRNISTPDISKSILQAVALQSITTLARGYDIKPKVLFIGGPLTFLPALQDSFKELLKLGKDDVILPENSQYFPAWGAALHNDNVRSDYHGTDDNSNVRSNYHCSDDNDNNSRSVVRNNYYCSPCSHRPPYSPCSNINLNELIQKLENSKISSSTLQIGEELRVRSQNYETLPQLFKNETEYENWKKTRNIKKLKKEELGKRKKIECFLGIDSGSTTTKILIMEKNGNIVYTFYSPNEGNPLKKVLEGLQKFYDETKENGVDFEFISSASTGYGEDLIKQALGLDYGIVETMAHLSGAQYVDPKVSFILDIGGQDMKSIFINKGIISNIELNEACSSGCGSFLQNFASTMNLNLEEFSKSACLAKNPCDLGSRCTVFMNSKVKQSLRENATIGDISAGLAYSVVKNCLFKVLKISNLNSLGDNIVVQGGTFRNDSVYRALEILSDKKISSTDNPELMGALGAALYAQKMSNKSEKKTLFTGKENLPNLEEIERKEIQCQACTNKCNVICFKFKNGNISFAGNKCEKVFFNKNSAPKKGFNAFDQKNKILFERENNTKNQITIGIPRALNMYENYPFWHTFLTECGFNVLLSPESTFSLYQKGIGSITSENICFPAKLTHGHIIELIEAKVDRIFFPIVQKDQKEFKKSNNSFNCPIVSGYPEVIKSSINPEEKYGIPLDKPVISFHDDKILEKGCYKYISSLGISKKIFNKAFEKALEERKKTRKNIKNCQKDLFHENLKNGKLTFVVTGSPYQSDPLIHQKIGQILSDLGVDVFTDDILGFGEGKGFENLNVVSQWVYSNKSINAAIEVSKLPQNVQLIQLNSFGCGPDSFILDEITNILKNSGKNHTILKIDEIASPGSIRLRLRSLVESVKLLNFEAKNEEKQYKGYDVKYTEKDKEKTILIPWFADFLSPFIPAIGELAGYKIENVQKTSKNSAEIGLKYGNNEVCYPLTLVLGDIIYALQSGKYDINNIVVGITQTGGQCRATNYLSQIKLGLTNAGFGHIPVIAVGTTGQIFQNEQEAFKIPFAKLSNIIITAMLYGDALQQMYNSIVIKEKNKGETEKIFDKYMEKGVKAIKENNAKKLLKNLEKAITEFNEIKIIEKNYTKVGLIGEIYIKYNNYGQSNISKWLQSQNIEVVTPPILDFFMQYFVNTKINTENGIKEKSLIGNILNPILWYYLNNKIEKIENLMKKFRFYTPSESVFVKSEYAKEIIDLSNQFGEGWLIAAEIASYAHQGINKIVCIQPFGCIANHIVAKGIEKSIKNFYPNMNLLYLDIDDGVAKVNLQNRLHFLMDL